MELSKGSITSPITRPTTRGFLLPLGMLTSYNSAEHKNDFVCTTPTMVDIYRVKDGERDIPICVGHVLVKNLFLGITK